MRETGNNTHAAQKILSIRLRQGGLSFYMPDWGIAGGRQRDVRFVPGQPLPEQFAAAFDDCTDCADGASFDLVRVFVDTADTVYVPREQLPSARASEWLVRMGVYPAEGSEVLVTEDTDGVCAVFPVEKGIVSWLERRTGGRMEWRSPMHEMLAAFRRADVSGACLAAYPTQEQLYVAGYDAGGVLTLAEVYPLQGVADMVYYLYGLSEGRRDTVLYVYGDRPVRYAGTLARYFDRVAELRPVRAATK